MRIFNIVWFQSIFWLCVTQRNEFVDIVFVILLLHFVISKDPIIDSVTASAGFLMGMTVDGLFTALGLFVFDSMDSFILPAWLICIWIALSCCLRYGLELIKKRPALACIAGAVFGPISYGYAQIFGAVDYPYGLIETLVIVSLKWAISLPLLVMMISKIEMFIHPQPARVS